MLGTVKHFFGDGATLYGANQGNAVVGSFDKFIEHNIQGFNGSIRTGMATVMPSFSGINFIPLSEGSYIKKILRDDLDFDGFVISDYDAINYCAVQGLPASFGRMRQNESTFTMFSSGVDMFLMGQKASLIEYVKIVKEGILNNSIDERELDFSVTKILAVKLAFGLVKKNENLKASLREDLPKVEKGPL